MHILAKNMRFDYIKCDVEQSAYDFKVLGTNAQYVGQTSLGTLQSYIPS